MPAGRLGTLRSSDRLRRIHFGDRSCGCSIHDRDRNGRRFERSSYALGTISATLVLLGNLSPTLKASRSIAPTQARGLDRDGYPIVKLGDNTVLLQAATKWNSPACSARGAIQPRGGKGLVCSSWASPITISGATQDVSTNLNGVALALSFLTNDAASVLPIQKASIYGVGDVGITNAISNLVGGNGIVWADYSANQTWASCPTWGSGDVHLMLSSVTFAIAVNCTIPANVTLDLTRGAMLRPANSTTTTIVGIITAGRQQIFTNALATQGRVVFTGNIKMDRFYPDWWGTVKDGATNDLAALQATSEAADTVGAGTVDLGKGDYFISTGVWKIGNSASQHFLNVVGQGPSATRIRSTNTSATVGAIYLQKEINVHMEGFTVLQIGTIGTGVGIVLGGDAGTSGTQSNGNLFDMITIDSFDVCLGTTFTGGGTSSELTFINQKLLRCNTGFLNSDFNGLDFTFIQLEGALNGVMMQMTTAGLNVFGGSSSSNGTDFVFSNDGQNQIRGFRSEGATNQFVKFTSSGGQNHLTISDCEVAGLSTPNAHNAIIWSGGHLEVDNSDIQGQIFANAGDPATAALTLRNNTILDPNNTYTATSTPTGMGPGFRIETSFGNSGPRFESVNNVQFSGPGAAIGFWPSGVGHFTSPPAGGGLDTAVFDNSVGQGAALTVTGNAIQPSSYVHHVGAGLIRNINIKDQYGRASNFNNCIHLIADAAYTTDTTGNVTVALTAVTGQVITWCLDTVTAKWYPSGGAGAFTTATANTYNTTTNCGASGSAGNPSIVACGSAAVGAVACNVASSTGTCVINTSAVTANSEIFVEEVTSESARLGITCNASPSVLPAIPVASKSAGVSFTINMPTIVGNPACFDYHIVN